MRANRSNYEQLFVWTMEAMKSRRNIIGPQIRKLRNERGWSQEQLAAKMKALGLPISSNSLARIESGEQVVADYEAYCFLNIFNVEYQNLLPENLNIHEPGFHDRLIAYLDADE